MITSAPLLSIVIPTYNRAGYLRASLAQLRAELASVDAGLVEVLVSDNCSPDDTGAVVDEARRDGLEIRYVRNPENLGWARNFAQGFDLASGRYVLLMGDDDLFVDGALGILLDRLSRTEYGVVCLRPYGFEQDFRREHPGGGGAEREFQDASAFLVAIQRYFTLTSACVVNKSLLKGVDSRQFITSDIAVFHLLLRAALAAKKNLFIERYLVASRRQNSFGYQYASVFVGQLWSIVDAHIPFGLSAEAVRKLERKKILSYYPFYLFDLRTSGRDDLEATRAQFDARFRGRWLYTFWLRPAMVLPRPLAVPWSAATTLVGRILDGDLRRGLAFAWNRVTRRRDVPAS